MKSTGQGIRNVSFSEHFAYPRANFFGNVASDFLRFSINDEILNGKLHFLCSAIQHYFMISLFCTWNLSVASYKAAFKMFQ